MKQHLRMSGCLVVVALCACSNGTTGTNIDECAEPFTACGGSVAGTWRSTANCGNPSAAVCAESSTTTTGSLQITFDEAGTFTADYSGAMSMGRYPPSCFKAGGILMSCAQLAQGFMAS